MTTPMILSILIFVVAYIFIASEKIDKAAVALIGAGLMVGTGAANFEFMLTKVDLNVISLLVGMMIIVNILATTGVFEWLAVMIAKQTRGNGVLVVIEFLLATAFVSAFMDNVTTIILMAPVTILICQLMSLPVVPILILEAIFSNIGGTATLIGDPPNILIGASCGLSFNDFIINLAPIVIVIVLITLVVVMFIFKKQFKTHEDAIKCVMQTEPKRAILNPKRLKIAMVIFGIVLLGFFTGRLTHIEPGLIAMCGGLFMVIFCKVKLHHMLEKVEWPTILFFCGLFMMVGGLEQNGVFEYLGTTLLNVTNNNFAMTMMIILWSTAILSAIVDNIPLVIAMIPLTMGIIPTFVRAQFPEINLEAVDVRLLLSPEVHQAFMDGTIQNFAARFSHPDVLKVLNVETVTVISKTIAQPLLWSLALGACLGGNGTLIGASVNVIVEQIAHKNNYPISFMRFTAYGFPLMILSAIISTIYLYFRYIY